MFTQAQAMSLRENIIKEAPHLDVQIHAEGPPFAYEYYLVVSHTDNIRFVIRDEEQWRERKHLVI